MKNLNTFLLIAFLLASCVPAAIVEPTQKLEQTQTTTLTLTDMPAPTNTSTPTITPTPLPITFIYQDNVPANGRTLQELATYKAYISFSQYADLGSIKVYTFEDINLYVDQIFPAVQFDVPTNTKSKFIDEWGNGGNFAAKDIVVIGSGTLAWNDDTNLCYKPKNVAHELFHTLQSRLIKHGLFRPALDYGPEWLKEGSAEVFGHKIADGLNGCSYSKELDWWKTQSTSANYPLQEVDDGDFSSKIQFWSLAPYAVDYLISLAPKGEQSVIDYYSKIGNGISWKESFNSAFGLSVEEFYTKFDSSRTKDEIDTSVCIPQTNSQVKCLGLKPNKDFIFEIPIGPATQANEWKVESACGITGWGLEGSTSLHILQISVTDNTHGVCQVKIIFSDDQLVIVDFVVP